MSKITLNPNSVFTNSQANFIINKDAVYAFNRSISAINNSVYGIQPTKAQYISGITLEDMEPLSSNHSLCAEVYFLNNNIDALKFFAQRPFVPCTSIENRDETAKNPLAIYLTPLPRYNPETGRSLSKRKLMNNLKDLGIWEDVKTFLESEGYQDDWDTSTTLDENDPMLQTAITALKATFGLSNSQVESLIANSIADDSPSISANDSYEWIYVLPESYTLSSGEVLSGWDFTKYVYKSGELLTTFGGTWELIGSTSLTDEKISSLFGELNTKIEAVSAAHNSLSTALSNAIDNLSTNLLIAINTLSTDLSGDIDKLSTDLSTAINTLSVNLSGEIDKLSTAISGDIDDLSTALSNTVKYLSVDLSTTIDFLSSGLSNAIDDLGEGTEEEISFISTAIDQISATLSSLSSDLSSEIDSLSTALSNEINNLSAALSGEIGILSTALSLEISSTNEALGDFIDLITEELSTNINPKLSTIAECVSAEVERVDEISVKTVILSDTIPILSNHLTGAINRTINSISSYLSDAIEDLSASLSNYALSAIVADAYKLSIGNAELSTTESSADYNSFIYRFYQGDEEIGHIDVPRDQFISAAEFEGTILVLELQGGHKISTDLKDVVDILSGDDGEVTKISVYVNPETNIISAALLEEYATVSQLSDTLNDYVKKSDLCAAILPNLEEYNHYLSGDIPRSISAIYDWSCAIHAALLSCCGVVI